MTFNHDDIRERLVDFLYGELDDGPRAAFDAHLKACDACRGDVARAEQARGIGRAVARAPLGDAVPPGVRARALAAAHAAANAKAVAVRESRSAREPASGRGTGTDAVRGPSWFERLRRRWAVPVFSTFATVAALAVLLLARGTIFREAQHPLGERTLDDLASKRVAAPASPPHEPRAPSMLEGTNDGREPAAERPAAKRERKRGDRTRRDRNEVLPPARPTDSLMAQSSESELDGQVHVLGKAGAASTRRTGAQSQPAQESLDGDAPAPPSYGAGPAAAARSSAQPKPEPPSGTASAVAADSSSAPRPRGFATPGPAVNPSAPSPAGEKPTATGAPLASPTSGAVRSNPAKKSASRASEAATGAPAGSPADVPADTTATLVERGEAAMAAHRWNEAAAIYHQLLRSYPRDAAAQAWHGKLAAAEAAVAAEGSPFASPPPSK